VVTEKQGTPFVERFVLPLVAIFIASFIVGSIGCASPHKCVLVSVVDSKTGRPVAGATVSVHSHPRTRTVTSQEGSALLKLNCTEAQDAIFDVEIVNPQYNQNFGFSETGNEWMNRPNGFIPTKPDIVLEVVSRFDESQAELEKHAEFNTAAEAAQKLFLESPDLWPERTNAVAEILFSNRPPKWPSDHKRT